MALQSPAYGYCDSVSYAAIAAWATGATIAAGALRRQLAAPTVGNERIFVCIVGGTTHATTEPTWVITRGGKTTDNTVTWQECTGRAPLNGGSSFAVDRSSVQNLTVPIGYVVKNNAGTAYFICSTGGTTSNNIGSGMDAITTAGTTFTDNAATWTCLGVVGNWTAAFGCAHARLNNAVSATFAAGGDKVWLGDDHADTRAATATYTGTSNTIPVEVYCVDHTKANPVEADRLATARCITTGANSYSFNGALYFNGVIFEMADGASAGTFGIDTVALIKMENCAIKFIGTGASNANIGQTNDGKCTLELVNTPWTFSAVGQTITQRCGQLIWRNTPSGAVAGAAVPTTLFLASRAGTIMLDGLDLSALGSGKTIFAAGSNFSGSYAAAVNCKLGASVTKVGGQTQIGAGPVDIINCDSGATGYIQERHHATGDLTTETTIIRTGGASDGVQGISWKIVSAAVATRIIPFKAFEVVLWNVTVGAPVTLTVELVNDGLTLTNGDVWGELEYLNNASFPVSAIASSGPASPIASTSNLTTSVTTWTTTGLGSPVKQKIAFTFTPQMVGDVRMTLFVARPSLTLYVDPILS